MLKKGTSKQWLIMTALFACVTYAWIVIGESWINPTLLFAGAIVLASGAVLSFSLSLARAVHLKGLGLYMMTASVVVTIGLSTAVIFGIYVIVA
ncbi:hypothetical protein RIF24_06505 [Exiguobacterium acetylicum]|uniref:hypothetical protein n=1 Tax=Exiguobacterium acetylicum TaxID=41170 RepID=UPI003977D050